MLENLIVVELASVLAGPSVGMFFAELGARVIKVENPKSGGDVTRGWRLANERDPTRVSAYFSSVNWGKESVGLDLTDPKDRSLLNLILAKADILLTSFRPGAAKKLSLAAEEIRLRYPQLIIGEINGYGEHEGRPAYDAIVQAETGFTYLNGPAGEGGYKMPVALMDVLAAHQLKEALLLALLRRTRTDEGGRVSVSLFESGVSSLVNQASNYLVANKVPEPMGSSHPNIVPYGTPYPTRDGDIVLAVGSDQHFQALGEIMGWDTATITAYSTNALRVARRTELESLLGKATSKWKRKDLLGSLANRGVPAGAIYRVDEACAHPLAQRITVEADGYRGLRGFVAQTGDKPQTLAPPPQLGAHTARIRREFGVAFP